MTGACDRAFRYLLFMSNAITSSTAWKQPYQLALLETDLRKIPSRVYEARTIVSRRLDELALIPHCEERDALAGALRFLRILEKETLEESL